MDVMGSDRFYKLQMSPHFSCEMRDYCRHFRGDVLSVLSPHTKVWFIWTDGMFAACRIVVVMFPNLSKYSDYKLIITERAQTVINWKFLSKKKITSNPRNVD